MRYCGNVGYRITKEAAPSVWTPEIIERKYYGDVVRASRRVSSDDKINSDISIDNQISIICDPFALENFHSIIYIWWMGTPFTVSRVEVEFPRLLLTIGDIYNGERPAEQLCESQAGV